MSNTGNGNKAVVLNTRERILSTDANRAQTFYGQGVADLLRFMIDASSDESRLGGGYEVLSDGTETPPRAYVVNGLRPQPVNGTNSLLVSPGVMLIVDNPSDPNADDSVAAWVTDPGISNTGILILPANASGQAIIGIVECQRTTQVLEQDNRDVFNVVTGLFSPQLVNKVTAGRLVYRIRLGTPAAGFPGVAAGWSPLAVFNQPAAAATWDDVLLIWDVRRLVGDRWNAPFNTPLDESEVVKAFAFCNTQVSGSTKLFGELDANYLEARVGGRVGLSDPTGATPGFFDVQASASRTGNFTGYSADSFWHAYAIFPFGLPRWQQYSAVGSAAPRRPCGQRGILAVTDVGPTFAGTPSAVVSTPTATGLLDTPSQSAVCLLSGNTNSGAGVTAVMGDGRVVIPSYVLILSPSSTSGLVSATWTLTDNVTHPGNARAVWVEFFATFDTGGSGTFGILGQVTVTSGDNLGTYFVPVGSRTTLSGNVVEPWSFSARLPLSHDNFSSSARTFTVIWAYLFGTGAAVTAQVIRLLGWEVGP